MTFSQKRHAIYVLIVTDFTVMWLRFLRFREVVPNSPAVLLGELWQVNILAP